MILADDHSIMRNGLATLLGEQADIRVVAQAANGQEAIDLCREHQPHVLVLDVAMPVLDGVQACRAITQEMPSVHIIGLSMFDSADLARPMLAAGADSYLSKAGPPTCCSMPFGSACISRTLSQSQPTQQSLERVTEPRTQRS